jgi:hypothetical protein
VWLCSLLLALLAQQLALLLPQQPALLPLLALPLVLLPALLLPLVLLPPLLLAEAVAAQSPLLQPAPDGTSPTSAACGGQGTVVTLHVVGS